MADILLRHAQSIPHRSKREVFQTLLKKIERETMGTLIGLEHSMATDVVIRAATTLCLVGNFTDNKRFGLKGLVHECT